MLHHMNLRSIARLMVRLGTRFEESWIDQQVERLAGPKVSRIFTYTPIPVLRALFRLARQCPPQATAVEIGSHFGASTCYLAAGLNSLPGRLYCVDTWNNETMADGPLDTFSRFSANVARLADSITPIRKPSEELTAADVPGPIHLAFIDGDHSYPAAKRDFDIVSPWLAHSGFLAFHAFGRAKAGVTRLVAEVLNNKGWLVGGVEHTLIWLVRK